MDRITKSPTIYWWGDGLVSIGYDFYRPGLWDPYDYSSRT
jgi:hypothetical protein